MSFEWQPTLRGQLVALRPLRESDFEALYAAASDPLVWEQHPESNRFQREVFQKFFRGAIDSGGAVLVSDAMNGEVIGSSRYLGFNKEESSVEVGYTFLARRCWQRGYNRELKKLMLNHAFRFVDSVVFRIGKFNQRSRTAVEKIGAKFEREVESIRPDNGIYVSVEYRLRKGEEIWAK